MTGLQLPAQRIQMGSRHAGREPRLPALRVVGSGVKGNTQLTLEGLHHLRAARLVMLIGGPAQHDLMSLGLSSLESLDDLYLNGARDKDNYDRIVNHVLARLDTFKDVALLVPGHPRLGVSLVSRLEESGREGRFNVTVIPGVSSFDTMIVDLGIDPLERGSLVVDANRLLLFDERPNPSFDTFIYHVCSVGTSATNYLDPTHGNKLVLLQDLLLATYPSIHPVKLIESAIEGAQPSIVPGEVGRLAALLPQVTFSSTLFVPSARPHQVNRNVLELLAPEFVSLNTADAAP